MSIKLRKWGADASRAHGGQYAAIALAICFAAASGAAAAQAPAAGAEGAPLSQAPPKPPPAPKPPPNAPLGTPAMVIDGDQAEGIIGMQVRSASGADMGRIVDVVVDRAGHVRAAVIDFGGFLGVGTRHIAVDWSALHFPSKGKMESLVVDLDRNQLKLAPIYNAGEPMVVLGGSNAPAQPPPSPPRPPAPGTHS